ncbi:chemotaxis protein CheW [Marinagarivorans algicola]|uniref:chemotaxis protein CheW n=1 Tax=Marinagarivorans algicola TaxID=1513270 RepID=UPI0006B43610|nr:chemotaxis protein CheW [Marinagarivorans algicola]
MNDNTVDNDTGGMACFVLPIQAGALLVPSISIAEVASVAPIFPDNSGPDWFLGHYNWRNRRVPLISFEKLTRDQGGGINPNGRIVLFKNTGANTDVGFIAIPTQGIPREVMVMMEDVTDNAVQGDLSPFEVMSVNCEGEEMTIPDLTALEDAYLAYKDKLL